MGVKQLQRVPGVGAATARRLLKSGIRTPAELACARPEMVAGAGLTAARAGKLIAAAGGGAPAKRAPGGESILATILGRIAGRESTVTVELEGAGFDLGELRMRATGTLRASATVLAEEG